MFIFLIINLVIFILEMIFDLVVDILSFGWLF